MKVLFCTNVPLNRSSGGTLVCREHLERITALEGCEVHVICPVDGGQGGSSESFVTGTGAKYHPFLLQGGAAEGSGRGLARWWPFSGEVLAAKNATTDLKFLQIYNAFKPDVVVMDYLFSALFFPAAYSLDAPVMMITLNREAEFYRQRRDLQDLSDIESDSYVAVSRLKRFENEVYRESDAVVFLTPNDVDYFPSARDRARVIRSAIHKNEVTWSYRGHKTLFFVGNIQHYPNRVAVQWLCENFAPALQEIDPDVSLKIIGAADDDVPEHWRLPNVGFMGRSTQEEVQNQFTSCGMFIAPIENNFGSKIKVLECLAYETPLMASEGALSGLHNPGDIPRFSLDAPDQAARMAAEFLSSPEKAASAAEATRVAYDVQIRKVQQEWADAIHDLAGRSRSKKTYPFWSFLHSKAWPKLVNAWPKLVNAWPKSANACPKLGHYDEGVAIWGGGLDILQDDVWSSSQDMFELEGYQGEFLRWTGRDSEIRLPKSLVKTGSVLAFGLWDIGPKKGVNLTVSVNGTEVFEANIKKTKFPCKLPMPNVDDGRDEFVIRFQTPGVEAPGDPRPLGVALKRLEIVGDWH